MTSKATLTALTLAAVMAAGLSTALNAQGMGPAGDGPRPMPGFAALDANGDGAITPDEIAAYRAKQVAELDANGDGFLTADEIRPSRWAR